MNALEAWDWNKQQEQLKLQKRAVDKLDVPGDKNWLVEPATA